MNSYPYEREPILKEGQISEVYGIPFYEKVDIQVMIEEAYARGDKKIVIPKGAYRVWAKEGRSAHILLKDMEDFVVEGYGVVLVCQDFRKNAVSLVNCERVKVAGITTDFEPYGMCQAEIIGFDEENNDYFDVHVEKGYQCDFWNPDITPDICPGDFYDGVTHDFKKGMRGTGYFKRDLIEDLGDRNFRFHIKMTSDQRERLKIGDFYCFSSRPIMRSGLTLGRCSHCVIKDFTVWAGLCGVAESMAKKQTFFDNFRVVPGPKPYGAKHDRVCVTAADGCHMAGNREGARMENCVFDHCGDDGINYYGYFFRVAEQVASDTIIFAQRHVQEMLKGDRLRIYTSATEKVGEAVVVSSELVEGYEPKVDLVKSVGASTFRPGAYFRVKIDRELAVTPGDWVNNANCVGNGFVLRNNVYRNLRPRGCLIKASDGVIENCSFYNIGTAGIQIRPEFDWLESGYSHNVTIRGCTFENCGSKAQATIVVSGQRAMDQTDIVIEDCTFRKNVCPEISLAEGKNIVVRDNRFGLERMQKDTPVVLIRSGDGIRFENNTFPEDMIPVAGGSAPQQVSGAEMNFYSVCSAALMTGKQGHDGWHFQYAPIGTDDYHDFENFIYSAQKQDGWWHGEEDDLTHGCITRWWFDTYMHPGEESDVVKTFICPKDGEILINAASYIVGAPTADGINLCIRKNSEQLWPADRAWETKYERINTKFEPLTATVKAGDQIHFRVNKNGNIENDGLDWNPTILYL